MFSSGDKPMPKNRYSKRTCVYCDFKSQQNRDEH